MKNEFSKANLKTINNGAAVELFDEAFKRVLDNVNDISTDPSATREIVIKFKIKPSKDRRNAKTLIECNTKLPGILPHESHLFLGHEGNKPVAHISNLQQTEMFNQQETAN